MNDLQFFNFHDRQTLDSRQVAEMLGKEHYDLLKDIKKYIEYFTDGEIPFSDFFMENQYIDPTGRKLPCYQITKKGCEFLAHKLTGQKGAIFTAKYIEAFDNLKSSMSLTAGSDNIIQMLVLSQKNILDMMNALNKKIDSVQNAPMIQMTKEKQPSKKQIQDEKLKTLIKRQSLPKGLKILKFPTKIIDTVDILLSQEKINYSYIRKILKEKGYIISLNAIVNYHKAIQGEF